MPKDKEILVKIILVDKDDKEIGSEEKLKAHLEGKLHRCFSILIFNSKGEILIQKRAREKYHSAGLWSNTCCSHPRPGKNILEEAKKRLNEEMGIEVDLKEVFSFIYKVKLGHLVEYEVDHVFFGKFDGQPKIDKNEVEDFKWMHLKDLEKDIKKHPQKYTFWFKKILDHAEKFKNLL